MQNLDAETFGKLYVLANGTMRNPSLPELESIISQSYVLGVSKNFDKARIVGQENKGPLLFYHTDQAEVKAPDYPWGQKEGIMAARTRFSITFSNLWMLTDNCIKLVAIESYGSDPSEAQWETYVQSVALIYGVPLELIRYIELAVKMEYFPLQKGRQTVSYSKRAGLHAAWAVEMAKSADEGMWKNKPSEMIIEHLERLFPKQSALIRAEMDAGWHPYIESLNALSATPPQLPRLPTRNPNHPDRLQLMSEWTEAKEYKFR